MTVLKKKYGGALPRHDRPVLETILFAALLENSSDAEAEAAFEKLHSAFHDLNEVRVSSVSEIELVLDGIAQPEWKALRIRELLQYTFERYYRFDLDELRRKTHDLAEKELGKIRHLTPFIHQYFLQHCLDAHVVPVDDNSRDVLVWLGLVEPDATSVAASEEIKSAVRKQEAPLFCHLVRCVAADRKYAGSFKLPQSALDAGIDASTAPERLKEHLVKAARKPARKVARARKPPAKSRGRDAAGRRRSAATSVRKRVSKPKPRIARKR
jgi:endonuclease-3